MRKILAVAAGLVLLSTLASAEIKDYLTLEWSFDTRDSNNRLYVLNLDDDPSLEIVADSERAGLIFGIDRTGEQIFRVNIPGLIQDLHAAEFSDNLNEIIAGTTPRAYSISGNGSYNWKYFTEHEKVGTVHLTDLDGDGRGEALLGVAGGFRGNKLLAIDEDGKRILKVGLKSSDFPNVLRAADLDGDGSKEIIVGFAVQSVNTISESMQVGYTRDASVRAYNLDGTQLWSYQTAGGVKDIEVADLDGDGFEEIIAGSRGVVYALAKDGTLLWKYRPNILVNDIKIRDVDSDGAPEILVATDRIHLLAANGSKIWSTAKIGVTTSVDAADFDDDGLMEFVAASGGIHLYDSEGKRIWKSENVKHATNVVAADLNQDGFTEVVAGSGDSQVRLFSSKPYLGKRKAGRLYSDALILYEAGDTGPAKIKAERAKLLYEGIVSADGAAKTTELLSNIEVREKADGLLSLAIEKYSNLSLASAEELANQSKALYTRLGISGAITEADDVLNLVVIRPRAEGNLSAARKLYSSGRHIPAYGNASKAKELFEWLNEDAKVGEAEAIMQEALPYVTAASHLDAAARNFDDGFVDDALTEISLAKETYASLDYRKGVKNAKSMESKVRRARLKQSRLFWMELVLLGPLTLITLVLAAAAYAVRRQKTKAQRSHLGGGEKPPSEKKKPKPQEKKARKPRKRKKPKSRLLEAASEAEDIFLKEV